LGLVWLIVGVYRRQDEDAAEIAAHVWDETLREGTAAAPLWWFWFILALLATSVLYLILYPGLGSFKGVLAWSQGGRIAASLARFDEQYGPERERLAAASLAELRNDATAMASAHNVFLVNCGACHGDDARGQANAFPDLTDASWQWGDSDADIHTSLTQGRSAAMPPWRSLGDEALTALTDHVLALSRGTALADTQGAQLFSSTCSACHGASGEGMPAMGAPALNDDAWLYGGDASQVRESIARGRSGVMPPFGERLDPTQVKLLVAWLTREPPR
jgi:cytochrome c oxidase cbb3-type subunit 3